MRGKAVLRTRLPKWRPSLRSSRYCSKRLRRSRGRIQSGLCCPRRLSGHTGSICLTPTRSLSGICLYAKHTARLALVSQAVTHRRPHRVLEPRHGQLATASGSRSSSHGKSQMGDAPPPKQEGPPMGGPLVPGTASSDSVTAASTRAIAEILVRNGIALGDQIHLPRLVVHRRRQGAGGLRGG